MMENDANESKLKMLPGCLTASLIAPFNEDRRKSLKGGRGEERKTGTWSWKVGRQISNG